MGRACAGISPDVAHGDDVDVRKVGLVDEASQLRAVESEHPEEPPLGGGAEDLEPEGLGDPEVHPLLPDVVRTHDHECAGLGRESPPDDVDGAIDALLPRREDVAGLRERGKNGGDRTGGAETSGAAMSALRSAAMLRVRARSASFH